MFGPVVALTATCSEAVLTDLKTNMLGPFRETIIVRKGIIRRSLRYDFVSCPDQQTGLRLVREKLVEMCTTERMIVFGPSKRVTEELASLFDCPAYHSSLSEEEMNTSYRTWINGCLKLICATSGFGLGIDYSHVRVVFFWGLPYDMESFAQQSGRAGRDSQPSYVCTLYVHSFDFIHGNSPTNQAFNHVNQFASSHSCRRSFFADILETMRSIAKTLDL